MSYTTFMPPEFIAQRCICCAGTDLTRSPAVLMPFVAWRVFGHEPLAITAEWGLRDLQPGTAYTLCNSVQCQQCTALFLDYRFTEQQMTLLYQGYRDEAYTRERERYEPGYAVIAAHYQEREAYISDVEDWLGRHLPEFPAVLDWGGGSGLNTPFIAQHRLLHVHDISTVQTLPGVERIGPGQVISGRYELIVCSQVLEHVPFPLMLIEQMLAAMDEHTLLYLEVPHEALMREHPGSSALAGLKRHWHEHINFLNERSLHCLLERAGLILVDNYRLSVDLGWRQGEVIGVLARRA